MHLRLTLLLLLATAFSAAAQDPTLRPVRTVVGNASAPAEIHFVDGNMSQFPVIRISKDLLRFDAGNDQSNRMPLTYVESVKFKDGCTLFFQNGQFQFDKLVQPAVLKNESGDVLLEGVLPLTREQAGALLGEEASAMFRKSRNTLVAGEITMMAGSVMLLPYLGAIISGTSAGNHSPILAYKDMSTGWKCVTIGGCGVLLAGAVISYIGNSGCNRVVATYNNGLGLAYSF